MNNRKLVTNYHLKEGLNKFHWMNNRKWVTFLFCLFIHNISCPKTIDSKYLSFSKSLHKLLKTNRMYVILFVRCGLIYEMQSQQKVSGSVFFLPIHYANFILKGSEWCWPLCYRTIWTHSCVLLQIVSDIASLVDPSTCFPMKTGGQQYAMLV
jgi:hypothetical protein